MEFVMGNQVTSAVLLVDDEISILEVMAGIIECAGFAAICVTSGAAALHKLKEQSFACMITDLHMLAMNGFELSVKAQAIAPDMLIALCTGDLSPSIRKEAVAAGIRTIFHKPIDFQAIINMLHQEIRSAEQGC